MRRKEVATGCKVAGAEVEGANNLLGWKWKDRGHTCGLGQILVLRVVACDPRWVSGSEELSLPHGWDGGGTCGLHNFYNSADELCSTSLVGDDVVETDACYETFALEMSKLHVFCSNF